MLEFVYSNFAVRYWRGLINQIHEFDFSKLDYEIIGKIFERLISPDERHKYGQYYTRAEVVDLINSFSIRTGNEGWCRHISQVVWIAAAFCA